MASLVNDPGGRKRISFTSPFDGKRKTIRLGEMGEGRAREFLQCVEHLIGNYNRPEFIAPKIIDWAQELDDTLHDRVARVGLLPPRAAAGADPLADVMTLTKFLTELYDTFTVKPQTLLHYGHVRRNLETFFTPDLPLQTPSGEDTIGDKETAKFRAYLAEELSPATVARRIISCRQIFKKAKKWDYIKKNPFEDVRGGSQRNLKRKFFVTREMTEKVIQACPDTQWKLIVALARYGGVRVPSEVYSLTWENVDWERKTVRIISPKTEHHEGKGERIIPLFPELEPHLQRAFDEAAAGECNVITRYRELNSNLRTHFHRIIRRAGLTPWPRTFQNLRASRETELFSEYPIETACAWAGNSSRVAIEHYLNDPDKDAHFKKATGGGAKGAAATGDAQSDAHMGESGVNGGKDETRNAAKTQEPAVFAGSGGGSDGPGTVRTTRGLHGISREQVESDAQSDARRPFAPDLAELVEHWPNLPPDARRRILEIVKANREGV